MISAYSWKKWFLLEKIYIFESEMKEILKQFQGQLNLFKQFTKLQIIVVFFGFINKTEVKSLLNFLNHSCKA